MKRLMMAVNVLIVATMLLSACATPTPETIIEKVVETQIVEIEKVVTQVVEKVVTRVVEVEIEAPEIVPGTPIVEKVIEKEVTRIVEKVVTATPIPIPTPTKITVETTKDTGIPGQLEVEYPVAMSPGSSNGVVVLIHTLPQIVSLKPIPYATVEPRDDVPVVQGERHSHKGIVFIAEMMRVELTSPSFEIASGYSPTQAVNITNPNEKTIWHWTIKAPDTLGEQYLTLYVYLGEDNVPSWTRDLKVEVVGRTRWQRVLDQLVDNLAKILIALIGLSGALVGYYAKKKRQKGGQNQGEGTTITTDGGG